MLNERGRVRASRWQCTHMHKDERLGRGRHAKLAQRIGHLHKHSTRTLLFGFSVHNISEWIDGVFMPTGASDRVERRSAATTACTTAVSSCRRLSTSLASTKAKSMRRRSSESAGVLDAAISASFSAPPFDTPSNLARYTRRYAAGNAAGSVTVSMRRPGGAPARPAQNTRDFAAPSSERGAALPSAETARRAIQARGP